MYVCAVYSNVLCISSNNDYFCSLIVCSNDGTHTHACTHTHARTHTCTHARTHARTPTPTHTTVAEVISRLHVHGVYTCSCLMMDYENSVGTIKWLTIPGNHCIASQSWGNHHNRSIQLGIVFPQKVYTATTKVQILHMNWDPQSLSQYIIILPRTDWTRPSRTTNMPFTLHLFLCFRRRATWTHKSASTQDESSGLHYCTWDRQGVTPLISEVNDPKNITHKNGLLIIISSSFITNGVHHLSTIVWQNTYIY